MADNNDTIQIKTDSLKKKMETMEGHFEALANVLKDVNSKWNDQVNILDEAIFGAYGGKILALWDANAATFGDFHANFDNWSALVSTVIPKNIDLEADIIGNYTSHGITLDGVSEAREYLSQGKRGVTPGTDLSEDAQDVVKRGETTLPLEDNEYGGRTICYTDADGNKVAVYYDKEGNVVCKHVYKPEDNGNDIAKDEDGNYREKFYDADGNEIDKKPDPKEYEEQHPKEDTESTTEDTESTTEETDKTALTQTQEINKNKVCPPDCTAKEMTTDQNTWQGETYRYYTPDGHVIFEHHDDKGNIVRYDRCETNPATGGPILDPESMEYYDSEYNQVQANGSPYTPPAWTPNGNIPYRFSGGGGRY